MLKSTIEKILTVKNDDDMVPLDKLIPILVHVFADAKKETDEDICNSCTNKGNMLYCSGCMHEKRLCFFSGIGA